MSDTKSVPNPNQIQIKSFIAELYSTVSKSYLLSHTSKVVQASDHQLN